MKIAIKKPAPDFTYDFEKSPFDKEGTNMSQQDSTYFSQSSSEGRRMRNASQVRYESFDSSQSQGSII